MKLPLRMFLWTSIIAGALLPALSNGGYKIINIEYIVGILFSLGLACICIAMARIRYAGSLLLVLWTLGTTALYFGAMLMEPALLLVGSMVVGFFFTVFAFINFEKALLLAGIVAFSQIAAAAVVAPSRVENLREYEVKRQDVPSVIHIMLDEHTGMATIPPEAVPPQEVQKFINNYVDHGFIVFTHAYTADHNTPPSLARLLNPGITNPWEAIKKVLIRHIDLSFLITKSSALDGIGKERALDITTTDFVNIVPAVSQNPALARELIYNINNVGNVARELNLTLQDRFIIAAGVSIRYLTSGIKSPLALWFFNTNTGQYIKAKLRLSIKLYAVISRAIFADMTARLAESGERGTYYFAHLIIPHDPYIFAKDCQLLPPRLWRNNLTKISTRQEWLVKYRLHFGQATCAAHDVFNLADAIKQRPELSDAIIFVHSDHGSRIIIGGHGHTNLDKFGSFIAIKIPGQAARVIDMPVRLDILYANLIANDFKTLNFDKLKPGNDSPYQNDQ